MKAERDLLWANIRELPYFRGMLRAVEGRFYQDLPLEAPTIDLGCGDGQFAEVTFPRRLELGVDPWLAPLREAVQRQAYQMVVQSYGQRIPAPDNTFASAVSNSVLEHIPDIQPVLDDLARVLKPGGTFYFCVPNHNFDPSLSIARFFDRIGLKGLARAYRRWFDLISRHAHLDDPGIWQNRVETAGLRVVRHWNYFSPQALAIMEWGHYWGLPAWIAKQLVRRWIVAPARWNLGITRKIVNSAWTESQPQLDGVCTFFICQKPLP